MRIQIDHLTRYHYTLPMRSVIQLLRVTPQTNAHQTVVSWHINVDCDARITPYVDAFGNACHIMAIDHSVSDLSIEVTGLVDTWPGSAGAAPIGTQTGEHRRCLIDTGRERTRHFAPQDHQIRD